VVDEKPKGKPRGRYASKPVLLNLKCEQCGVEFTRKQGAGSARIFCGQRCYLASDYHSESVAKANAARRADVWVTKPCMTCGTDVRRHTSRAPKNFFCSKDCYVAKQQRGEPIHIDSSGYMLVFVGVGYPGAMKSGHILEHRKVMQEILGRELLSTENVHHINGQRADNRPANLELWSVSQPRGQRVEDKIRWAREFLATYESLGEADVSEADSQAHP
jgi:endogenous inhibitor of DNA gyrase (YacG/DUF329 family)